MFSIVSYFSKSTPHIKNSIKPGYLASLEQKSSTSLGSVKIRNVERQATSSLKQFENATIVKRIKAQKEADNDAYESKLIEREIKLVKQLNSAFPDNPVAQARGLAKFFTDTLSRSTVKCFASLNRFIENYVPAQNERMLEFKFNEKSPVPGNKNKKQKSTKRPSVTSVFNFS